MWISSYQINLFILIRVFVVVFILLPYEMYGTYGYVLHTLLIYKFTCRIKITKAVVKACPNMRQQSLISGHIYYNYNLGTNVCLPVVHSPAKVS